MITVFADKYLYNIDKFLPGNCDLRLFNPAKGLPDNLNDADALLIRTVTKIDEQAVSKLPDSVEFIATGSAGTDHVDTELLAGHNIAFADAAGCNSRSVAEYVATALLIWSDNTGQNLDHMLMGIIGVGRVGTEVNTMLNNLGMATVCYDPPKEERGEDFKSAELKEVLSADILTFHTPLTETGTYSTYHWLDDKKLSAHNYKLVINTARGGVVDEQALLKAYLKGSVQDYIIDVWEDEPVFNDLIAENACIKTPHIAGYSKQAKLRASKFIAASLCEYFSLEMPDNEIGRPAGQIKSSNTILTAATLSDVLCQIHPIKEYEKELMNLTGKPPEEKGEKFNKLRSEFPLRDEYRYLKLSKQISKEYSILKKLAF